MPEYNQIRHIHPLQFVETINGLDEYVCVICPEVFWQRRECA